MMHLGIMHYMCWTPLCMRWSVSRRYGLVFSALGLRASPSLTIAQCCVLMIISWIGVLNNFPRLSFFLFKLDSRPICTAMHTPLLVGCGLVATGLCYCYYFLNLMSGWSSLIICGR